MDKFLTIGKDKYFSAQKDLKGKMIEPSVFVEPWMVAMIDTLMYQRWLNLFVGALSLLYE